MCLIDSADVDYDWRVVRESMRRARKPHRCAECARTIAPGETYRDLFAISEGDPYVARTCAHCAVACDWLVAVCRGYLTRGVLEDIEGHVDEAPLSTGLLPGWWLARVLVGMRRQWRRFDGAGLLPVPRLHPPIAGPRLPVWGWGR